jgi:hypothetical protein
VVNLSNPADGDGESTTWYASFRAFTSGYLSKRFNKRYCLNPEASLLLHTGNMTVPRQVTAVAKESGTTVVNLPFNTLLLVYSDEKRVPNSRVEVRGLQVWPVAEALCMVGPQFFTSHSTEAEIALAMVRDSSELLTTLLASEGMPTAAARLAGALRFAQRSDDADTIIGSFARAVVTLRPNNPFELVSPSLMPSRERSPYVLRLRSMWAAWREEVISIFPAASRLEVPLAKFVGEEMTQ